jgi:formamidopyrimidine-DNA glycosylase
MPELPEVESIAVKLQPVVGARIVDAVLLRGNALHGTTLPVLRRTVRGRTITAVERRAKNLVLRLENGRFLRIHLRMTGHLFTVPHPDRRPPLTRFYLTLEDGQAIVFEDSRTFGRVSLHRDGEQEVLFANLGPEPLGPEFTPDYLIALAKQSRAPAKVFLLDQRKIAGLGNIWAAEALWLAKIHPERPMNQLSPVRLRALRGAIVTVLQRAVESALAVAPLPEQFPDADLLEVAVYGREGQPCRACERPVRRIAQAGRSTFYCPFCQRR